MSKPNLLVLCAPDHYMLRGLGQIRELATINVAAERSELERYAPEAEIILNFGLSGTAPKLAEIWPLTKKVRWVHSITAGVEKVLFPALIASDVPVTNARGVFKRSLAEFAILGMLYFYKRVRRLVESQRAHKWDDFTVEWLPGKIMGVAGYGEIGRECAKFAKALGVTVYAVRRKPELSKDDPILDRVYGPAQLNEMLGEIDVLVAAAPLTPETEHMISDAQFAAMKPSAIVMNVGRGPVIDEAALIRALQQKRVAGAALDVFEQEPIRPDHPFWEMENVLISPHCTDRTSNPDWLDLSMQCFLDNFHRYLRGEPLLNIVDKQAGY